MSFSSRTQLQDSEVIQDSMPVASNFDNEGDELSATEIGSNQTIGKLVRWVMGLSRVLGETGRRKGSVKFHGADTSLTGTITSSGTAVTGSGTAFLTELAVGDFIAGTANEFREVTAIATDTSLTLASAFTTDIASGQAAKRITTLAERLETFLSIRGLIQGGIVFNTVSLPPSIQDGGYEVNGRSVAVSATATLALTDTINQSKQTLDSYCQYLICMDSSGTKKYIMYGEGEVSGATGTITSITGAGTTKTITPATGTVGSHTDKIIVVTGNSGVNGVFKITGGNGSSNYTFESVSTLTGTGGTWTVYERIKTLHGTGSAVAVTTDAEVLKYSPSYGENGWPAGTVAWSPTLQGYYLTITGLTGYRVLGNFRTNGSSQVVTNVISHKTGRNKNDNSFHVYTNNGFGGTNTKSQRYSSIGYILGSDYILRPDDAATGAECVIKRAGKFSGSGVGGNGAGGTTLAVTYNANGTLTPSTLTSPEVMGSIGHNELSKFASGEGTKDVYPGDLIRVQSDVVGDYNAPLTAFRGVLTL